MANLVDMKSLHQRITFRLLVVLGFLLHSIANLWNVDPYHEGALFPTAVGIAEGLPVFSGVSQQYGFLGPLLVSLPVQIFGNYLVVQRVFGLLATFMTTWLFYRTLNKLTSELWSRVIIVAWLLISPVWSWPINHGALSGGYWPNQIGLIFVLLGLTLIQMDPKRIYPLIAGFLIFISSQARMEFYFVWLFIALSILVYKNRNTIFFMVGSFFGFIGTLAFLLQQGALRDWFEQTIRVWTLTPPDVPEIGVTFFLFNGINFLGVALVAIVLLLIARFVIYRVTNLLLALAIQIVATAIPFFAASKFKVGILIGNFSVDSYLEYVLGNTLFSLVNLTILLFLAGFALKFAKYRFSVTKLCVGLGPISAPYVAGALGSLSLFHNFNPDYSYMVWPLFILGVLVLFKDSLQNYSILKRCVVLTMAAISTVSILAFVFHAQKQSYPYQTKMLRGLYGNSFNSVNQLDAAFNSISDYARPRKMLMVCQTGLFSVSDIGFLGSDKWTWNQQPQVMISNRLTNLEMGQTILACKLNSQDRESVIRLLKLNKIRLVSKSPQFNLYEVIESYQQQ